MAKRPAMNDSEVALVREGRGLDAVRAYRIRTGAKLYVSVNEKRAVERRLGMLAPLPKRRPRQYSALERWAGQFLADHGINLD